VRDLFECALDERLCPRAKAFSRGRMRNILMWFNIVSSFGTEAYSLLGVIEVKLLL